MLPLLYQVVQMIIINAIIKLIIEIVVRIVIQDVVVQEIIGLIQNKFQGLFLSHCIHYKTNSTKSLIPTALSPYEVVDLGGTSPRFCRMSMKNIPRQKELLKTCGIPFGAMIRPIAPAQHNEDGVSRVDFREGNGPIRCERCGAFVSSFCTFENDGATWNCKICNRSNNVPPSYKSPLDAYGHRYDKNDRPELSKGTVEYLVTIFNKALQEKIYLILIDVSLESLQSGLFQSIISNIKFYIEMKKYLTEITKY